MATTQLMDGPDTISVRPSEKLTKNEKLVFDVIDRANKPMKAYDLLEAVMDNGIRAPMSVYRALKGLTTKGLIHKVTHLNAYVPSDDSLAENTVRASVTCEQCQRTMLVSLPQTKIAELFGTTGMQPSNFVIEARGSCSRANCPGNA